MSLVGCAESCPRGRGSNTDHRTAPLRWTCDLDLSKHRLAHTQGGVRKMGGVAVVLEVQEGPLVPYKVAKPAIMTKPPHTRHTQ